MAAAVNERAAEVDRQYFAATNVTAGSYGMYYAHNLHFIAYARWMQGRGADGIRAANALADSAHADGRKPCRRWWTPSWRSPCSERVRFGSWEADSAAPRTQREDAAHYCHLPLCPRFWPSGAGDRAGALREQATFEAVRAKIPADAMWGNNKALGGAGDGV